MVHYVLEAACDRQYRVVDAACLWAANNEKVAFTTLLQRTKLGPGIHCPVGFNLDGVSTTQKSIAKWGNILAEWFTASNDYEWHSGNRCVA